MGWSKGDVAALQAEASDLAAAVKHLAQDLNAATKYIIKGEVGGIVYLCRNQQPDRIKGGMHTFNTSAFPLIGDKRREAAAAN
eukprot:1503487-Prymnesium_polylepis.1